MLVTEKKLTITAIQTPNAAGSGTEFFIIAIQVVIERMHLPTDPNMCLAPLRITRHGGFGMRGRPKGQVSEACVG